MSTHFWSFGSFGRSRTTCVAAILMIGAMGVSGLTGCTSATADHHDEHVMPAHKPGSLRDAVVALESRWGSMTSADQATESGTNEGVTTRKREFLDIVGWLLELAADTDLRRADWDAVAEAASRIERKLAPTVDTPTVWKADRDVLADLAELRRLAEKVKPETLR